MIIIVGPSKKKKKNKLTMQRADRRVRKEHPAVIPIVPETELHLWLPRTHVFNLSLDALSQ